MAARIERESDGSDIEVDYLSDSDGNNQNLVDLGEEKDDQHRPEDRGQYFHHFQYFFEIESDSDEEFEGFHDDWIQDGFSPVNKREFQGIGGTSTIHPEETRSIQYFLDFWNDAMYNNTVTETNRYANEERTLNPPAPFSLAWQDIDAPTLKAFTGLCFVMGILELPGNTDYWRKSKRMFKTAFNDIMTKYRFNITCISMTDKPHLQFLTS